MRVEILISLAVCVSLSNSKRISEFRIFNGRDATEGQFPYQASLRNKHGNRHYCGASIINHRFVLTAAHCCKLDYLNPINVIVVVGALRQSSGGIAIDVDKITQHKEYDSVTGKNDIAIIRTVKKIIFTEKIQPIALPKEDAADGKHVIASGWGTNGVSGFEILQYVDVQTLSLFECRRYYKNKRSLYYAYDSNLCTIGEYNDSPCKGDSGGPLANLTDPKHRTLVGIVSWGGKCGNGRPAAYTRVYSYLNWIRERINEQTNWTHKIKSVVQNLVNIK